MSGSTLVRRIGGFAWQPWAMAMVVVLAATVRFMSLGAESLWTDELNTLQHIQRGPLVAVSESVVRGTPPLYYVIQTLLRGVVPPNEFGLRLVSALSDTCSVLLVYLFGRRIVGRSAAVFGAAFFAGAVRAIWFAQEARAYSLAITVTLLAAIALVRLVERPGWGRAVAHGLAVAVVFYTHIYAIFSVIGLEAAVLLSPRMRRRVGLRWAASLLVALLAFAPWAIVLFGQAQVRSEASAEGGWIAPPVGYVRPMLEGIAGFAPGPMAELPATGTTEWSTWVFPGLVLLGVFGVTAFRTRRRGDPEEREAGPAGADNDESYEIAPFDRRMLLGGWLVSVIAGGVLVSHLVLPIFTFRMATQAMPAIFLAAANGLRQLWKPVAILLVVGLVFLGYQGLVPYYTDSGGAHVPEKEQWREAFEYVIDHEGEFDAVFVVPGWHADHMELYASWLGQEFPEVIEVSRDIEGAELEDQVLQHVAEADRVLFITSHVDRDELGLTAVERVVYDDKMHWKQVERPDLRGVRMRVFRRVR